MARVSKITSANYGPGKGNGRYVAYSEQVNKVIDALNEADYGINSALTAATGSTQATGVALSEEYNIVTTCATAGDSVTLPVPDSAGVRRVIVNLGAAACDVFPASGGSIDDESADVAISLGVEQSIELISTSTTQWQSVNQDDQVQTGLWANLPAGVGTDPGVAVEYFDDFHSADYHTYDSNDDAGTGTNAFQDAAAGIYNVVTAAADNDYHAMSTVNESWKFEAGKKLWFEARFKLAEATTNESAIWFGLTDTLTTGGFQDDADGPLASYDGALIWKDEGTMTLDFETSNATTQATTSAMGTVVTNTWTKVGFYFDGTATTSTITPYYAVNDATAMTAGTAQNITLAGLEEMHAVFGVKAGPTAAAETLQVDYIKIVQLR